jgi:hypothetical protein
MRGAAGPAQSLKIGYILFLRKKYFLKDIPKNKTKIWDIPRNPTKQKKMRNLIA